MGNNHPCWCGLEWVSRWMINWGSDRKTGLGLQQFSFSIFAFSMIKMNTDQLKG